MYIREFSIPLNREDLCEIADGQYYVKYFFSPKEVQERLEDAKNALLEEGPSFIVDYFPTFYSFLQHFKLVTEPTRQKALSIISRSLVELISKLNIVVDDIKNIECEVRNDMRNITKMICYILIEMMTLFQDKHVENNSGLIDTKGKKKQKPIESGNWSEDKLKILCEVYSLLQLPIKMLWDPPVVDEEFVNLIANFCYKCLEDPNIATQNLKWLRETVFQIFGVLIKNYLHGLSFCVKVVQLLKSNEHAVNPLAKGAVQLVQECKCSNIVKEIVREITEADGDQLAADTSGTRSLNMFLVQVAESIPETIIPAIDLLVHHLGGDSYTMRMCVLEVLGEIVLTTLTKEDLDEELKKMRDEYLDCLEEHIHDMNAFVRSKVLQIWQKLCLSKSVPISRMNHLLELAIGRLNDKSTSVKKQAIHLIKNLLETNPYSAQLNANEIQGQIKEEMENIESLKKIYNVDIRDADSEWKIMEPKLKDIMEIVINKCNKTEDECEEINIEEKIDQIGKYLLSGQLERSVEELVALKEKCNTLFSLDKDDVDLIVLLKNMFYEKIRATLSSLGTEVQEKLNKCKVTIEYLQNALKFAELIDLALPIILTLLDSNVVTDVLESIHFFTAAYLFGFHRAVEGVRKMLYLMYSKESGVKSAVSEAYQNIYFEKKFQDRHHFVSIIKNMSDLILKLNESQLNALELIVRKWLETGLIDNNSIQVMFERFSKKISNTPDEYSWAALVLIRMVGSQEPQIIKSNIPVLLSQGLQNAKNQNLMIAKEVCRALFRLVPEKQHGKPVDETLRYPIDHEIFILLHKFMRDTLWRTRDHHYIPMAEEAVNLVFHLCDKPDYFCEKLITEIYERIVNNVNPLKIERSGKNLTQSKDIDGLLGNYEEKATDERTAKTEKTEEEIFEDEIIILTRFISVLGQVSANYILFLEGPVLNELKRRNQIDFERKMKKLNEKKNRSLKGRRNLENSTNERSNKIEQEAGEDLDFNWAAADDMDADEMRKKTENDLVTGNGYFAKFVPLILTICKNPGKFNNTSLQNAAIITLSKFMLVSSVFCEENVQLLVTICQKSHCPLRRKNAIIALGALQYRFPNTLEPWTSHMYGILRDPDSTVRLSAVLVLTDLIVNEMIKVRSNISDLALCIVDKDMNIARTVRYFFREYSQKGNSLFNVLPCLISNLTRPDSELTEDEFKTIMRFLLGLFTKDKQSEYLIDKLFQYFESATTERQWKDLAFCLSLLNYNDKGLNKILDNLRYFGNKLYLADVYEAFCLIISTAGKNPQKDKTLLKEIHDLIKECRDKSCQDKKITFSVQKKTSASARKRVVLSTSEAGKARRQLLKSKISIKEEVEDCLDDDGAFLSDSSVKKGVKTRYHRKESVKENIFSEDDSDIGESPRKRQKKVKSKARTKRLKAVEKYSDETSEEEGKADRVLRINRKRK